MGMQDTAIVGFAETKIVEKSDRDVWELGAEILEELLNRTGFEKQEIDGLILSSSITGSGNCFWSQTTADQLALEVDFCQTVDIGGCSPTAALARAAIAIDAGLCTTVLCLYADTQAAENNARPRGFQQEWQVPQGLLGPPTSFGFISNRYDHQFGLDLSALGKLAVAQRDGALLNDLACEKLRKPITVDDYINSRLIADPVRLLDSVMVCDGASGLLVTSKKNAARKGLTKIVTPIGYGERSTYRASESIVDVTDTGHRVAGARAFKQAGLAAKDIASIHPYDDFIIAIMLQFEMLGFCKQGEGAAFIREHEFNHLGDLPLNTGGGQISAGQCGLAGGGTNLIEAVRQLFGEGDKRQVKNTKNALVTGIGGIPYARNWSSSVVMILTPNG
ncbi:MULTISPECIES: thiolase family protein [unclassified Beijerinckia]|uniref:thiolase family protein n=1 Tax=unclassified Beijerinckia TaxID=2638183 RepID=UPI000894C0B1|nr:MULTISPECIES: thiolase family protein [unclassified Beijerinckia]MDH7795622.1 acetyl-CoA acetyltransferase [Beijerinckia sp. GAS462]SEC09194.1 Acetyl-CoA acetyltransferase [Beijerinckia sp. 28-YEA-48]